MAHDLGLEIPRQDQDEVRAAAALLTQLGAIVEEVSIPMHLYAEAITTPILIESQLMYRMSLAVTNIVYVTNIVSGVTNG